MVERGPRFSGKNLSRRDFLKIAGALGLGATLLSACQALGIEVQPVQAAEANNDRPTATAAEISPTIEASPTAETIPASLEANQAALKKMGYEIRQGERGWELISPQDQIVLIASDTLTVQAFGANSEMIISPEQAFSITKTSGLGMENLLTLSNTQGEVTHTYLEHGGYWAPLAEIQTNPREIENYPQVAIEDLWNGRLAQSEALAAEPFPEGTLVPDGFVYLLRLSSQGYIIELRDVVNGLLDTNYRYFLELLNKNNDYRRWTNFYRSQTPEGVDIIIATEQILMPDGETSAFLHHVIGGERPWRENLVYGGNRINLVQNVFLGRVEPSAENTTSMAMRPIVFSSGYDDPNPWGISFTKESNAGIDLMSFPQNNPANAKDGLEEFFRQQFETFDRSIPNAPIGEVEEDVMEAWQRMGVTYVDAHGIYEDEYFNTTP